MQSHKGPQGLNAHVSSSYVDAAHLIVPGAEASGLVAPIMVRPNLTTSLPSHTVATTAPLERKSTSLG